MAPMDPLQIFQSALDAQFAGGEWWTINAIALMISVALVSIAWMVSTVLNSSSLKGWAKEEFSQFIFTAVILATLVILIPIVNAISISLFDEDPFTSGQSYFVTLSEDMEQSITRLTILRMTYSAAESVRIPVIIPPVIAPPIISPPIPLAIAYGAPLKAPIGPFTTLSKLLYAPLMTAFGQIYMLDFMKYTMFTFILPLGVALRSFPITRRAGSTLISIAIVGYVIYPLSVNYGLVMYEATKDKLSQAQVPLVDLSGGDFINREKPKYPTPYMQKSEYMKWSVLTPEYSYRIWKSRVCSEIGPVDWNEEKQPPHGSEYKSWDTGTILGTGTGIDDPFFDVVVSGSGGGTISAVPVVSSGCYTVVQNGEGKFGEPIIFELSNPLILPDKSLSVILDIYNKKSDGTYETLGTSRIDTFVGDPCRNGLFNSISCYAGYDFLGESQTPIGTGIAIGKGFVSAMDDLVTGSGFARGVSGDSGLGKAKAGFTPYLASYIFLDFTETIPSSLFPAFMSVFTLVISMIISIASFRGISQMLRGESSIEELGRLI